MDNLYLWLKVVHIFGVVLFLGNIIVTGWWKNMADRTKKSSDYCLCTTPSHLDRLYFLQQVVCSFYWLLA